MSQQELLIRVARVLNEARVEFMITGSFASGLHGEPRPTHDIDLVVALPVSAIPVLVRAFPPPDFLLSEDAVRQAIANRSMFNLLAISEGDKVDFWMLKNEPFDQSRFARRRPEQMLGTQLPVMTPEDTILSKLRWSVMSGGSEKQFNDALRVYEAQAASLQIAYIEDWVMRLGVESLWKRILTDAKPLKLPE
jgi:hypothetical protein